MCRDLAARLIATITAERARPPVDPLDAALDAVGLPRAAGVDGLIRHHRNNEAAAQGNWKIAFDAAQEKIEELSDQIARQAAADGSLLEAFAAVRPPLAAEGLASAIRRHNQMQTRGDQHCTETCAAQIEEYAADPATGRPLAAEGLAGLLRAIGEGDESSGLEHWHHASGGRSEPTERDGVFVDRQQVLDLIDRLIGGR